MKGELIQYAKGMNAKEDVLIWIDKRIVDKLNQSECEHIIDYLCSDKRPSRLERATYEQMKNNTEKWNASMQKKGNKITETSEDVETVLDFNDGFKFVKLISKSAYEREGFLMCHCVASYFGRDVEIYSLRDLENNPHCTIEKDVQIKGKGNGDIHPNYIDYVVRFLEFTGMNVRDSEMDNLGYRVEMFPDYCINKLYKSRYIRKNEKSEYFNTVVIFDDLIDSVRYRGDKICLYSGSAYFGESQITDLGKLTTIGGSAYFGESQITDLGKLTTIGGYADFGESQITDKKIKAFNKVNKKCLQRHKLKYIVIKDGII